jgi:replicative DNA helicase
VAEKRQYTKKVQEIAPVPPNELGKLPPQALELEEAVLGAIMIENDAFPIVSEILKKEHFYKIAHQKIYAAVVNLYLAQSPIDMHTVTEQLRKTGDIEEIGGPYYIALLTAKVASAAHLEYHAHIIVQKYLARELIRISSDVQTKAFDDSTDVDDLMQEAEARLFEISQQNLKKDVTQIEPVIAEALKRIEAAAKRDDGTSGVASGFHALDKITSGWQKSDLIIIAARPAMGKTAFVLSMAKNIAVNYNAPVAVFSLEMSNVQLVNRLIMNVCSIEGEKIKNGKLSNDEWELLDKNLSPLLNAPIYIDDTPSLSIFELRSKARRLVKEHKIECLMIDYLQLMNASGMSFYSREQEISLISRSLKGLAKELDIPIIALSQLNRGVEGRTGYEGKRPQLSDLRESGAIEQDADVVCFIHRPEYYKITEDPKTGDSLLGIAEIIVAKHRNGRTDDIRLRFEGKFAKFKNFDDFIGENNYQAFSSKMNSNIDFYPETDSIPLNNEIPQNISYFDDTTDGEVYPF